MKVKELRDYLNEVAKTRPDELEEEITLVVEEDGTFLTDGSLDRIERGNNLITLESYGMCLIGHQLNQFTDPIYID